MTSVDAIGSDLSTTRKRRKCHPPTIKQADVTRAVRGVVAAGESVKSVRLDREGGIFIECGTGKPVFAESALDRWKREHG